MASSAVSTAVYGELVGEFSFERVPYQRLVTLPISIALGGPFGLWLILLSIFQATGTIPPGEAHVQERTLLMVIAYIVGVPSLLVVFGLPVWLKRPLHIGLYENGIVFRREFVRWEDVEAINVTTTAVETNCQLYATDGRVFSITDGRPVLRPLIRRIQENTTSVMFARMKAQFEAHGEVNFGNIRLSPSAIRQNTYQILFQDIAELQYDKAQNYLLVCHMNGLNRMLVILEGLSNGHLLIPFLQHLTAASTESAQYHG